MTNPEPSPDPVLFTGRSVVAEAAARVEIRVPVDATEAPLVYPDGWPTPTELDVEMAGPGVLATLVLPIDQAREWAGELFAAVAAAYREATGDPHAMSDEELSQLPPADAYRPGPGLIIHGDETSPARARFHLEVEIEAEFLSTAGLRAGLVEAITGRFNTTRIAVSAGEATGGTILDASG